MNVVTKPELVPDPPVNIYARKVRMVGSLASVQPDATHFKGYKYFSVHGVEAAVAAASIDAGVDVSPEVIETAGALTCIVTLTNVDDPADQIVKQFTNHDLPTDPANSYVVKYSYIRLFHMADQEDADRDKDETPAKRRTATPPANPVQPQTAAGGSGSPSSPQQDLLRKLKEKFKGDSKAASTWCVEQGVEYRTSYLLDLPTTQATELLNKLAKL